MKHSSIFPFLALISTLLAPAAAMAQTTPPGAAPPQTSICDGTVVVRAPFHTNRLGIRDGCYDRFHLDQLNVSKGVTYAYLEESDVLDEVELSPLVREDDWSNWGWTDYPDASATDSSHAYCALAESFSILESAGTNAEAGQWVLTEALQYVKDEVEFFVPRCEYDSGRSANAGKSGFWESLFGYTGTRLFEEWFEKRAGNRAGIFLHEAWHRGTGRSHRKTGPGNISQDDKYRNIYFESDSLDEGGVSTYSVHVAWLEDYIGLPNDHHGTGRATINNTLRNSARTRANQILRRRFREPTPKRLAQFTAKDIITAPSTTALADPWDEFGAYDYDGVNEETRSVVLGALPDEVCALTQIAGSFRGKDDFIRIETVTVTEGAHTGSVQKLTAKSDQNRERRQSGGVARCFPEVKETYRETFYLEDDFKDARYPLFDSRDRPVVASHETCFLTDVEGRLEGERDYMGVRVNDDGQWEVVMSTNTRDGKNYYRMGVVCINRPLAYTLDDKLKIEFDANGDPTYAKPRARSPSVLSDRREYPLSAGLSHSCAISRVSGRMYNIGDQVQIEERDLAGNDNGRRFPCEGAFASFGDLCTNWMLRVEGDSSLLERNVTPEATCFEYPQ